MNSLTLEQIWTASGGKKKVNVRFNDWNHNIKYFTIHSQSTDGRRFVGVLDNGERMSYPKSSKGWSVYYPESEHMAKAV